jgi:hypothetical protein
MKSITTNKIGCQTFFCPIKIKNSMMILAYYNLNFAQSYHFKKIKISF